MHIHKNACQHCKLVGVHDARLSTTIKYIYSDIIIFYICLCHAVSLSDVNGALSTRARFTIIIMSL